MKPSPSFRFYPNDWLSSRTIAVMTPEQEGAYIRLLCYAWASPDCSLPDDDAELARLSRLGESWHNGSGDLIKSCFKKRAGKLINFRLITERKKQIEWSKKSSFGGKTSGTNRRKKTYAPKGGSTTVEADASQMVEPKRNISFSFSSSSNTPPSPPLLEPEIGLTEIESPKGVSPFDDFRARYEWIGKPLNENDWAMAAERWISLEIEEKGLVAEVIESLERDIVRWRDSRFKENREWNLIPFPANWLRKEPWTRK